MAVEVIGNWEDLRPTNPMPVPVEEFPLSPEQARRLDFYDVVGDYIMRAVTEDPSLNYVDLVIDLNTYDFAGVREIRARYEVVGFAGAEIAEDNTCHLTPIV
jgi:hypothetical protein